MDKQARTSFSVHDLIASRWSPHAFSNRPVEHEKLGGLLEAARWAPSAFNEQPWVFFVATSDDTGSFERLASCLMEGNSWAKKAPLLMLSVAKLTFERNGKPNRHALHDVGLAAMSLVVQAEALGLRVHQMAGFDAERAREILGIPEGYDPVAMLAVGYQDEAETLPDNLRDREKAPRRRKELASFVFGAKWESPSSLDAR